MEARATDDEANIESGEYATEPSWRVSRVRRSHWVYLVSVPASEMEDAPEPEYELPVRVVFEDPEEIKIA